MIRKPVISEKFISGLDFLEQTYKDPPPPIQTKEGLQYTSERYLNNLLSNPPLDICEVSELRHISFTEKQKVFYNTLAEQYQKLDTVAGTFSTPKMDTCLGTQTIRLLDLGCTCRTQSTMIVLTSYTKVATILLKMQTKKAGPSESLILTKKTCCGIRYLRTSQEYRLVLELLKIYFENKLFINNIK